MDATATREVYGLWQYLLYAALPCILVACSPCVHVCRPSNISFDVHQGMDVFENCNIVSGQSSLAKVALVQVAATTLHHKAQQLPAALQDANEHQLGQAAGSDLKSPQGRSPAALAPPAAVSGATSGADDKTSKLAARAAELALKREDAELNQRAAAERRGLPSNVEGFK